MKIEIELLKDIDDAIEVYEKAADYDCYNESQFNTAKACQQIADWLKDYKELKSDIRCRKDAYWKPEKTGGFSPGGNPLYRCSNCGWIFGTHMIFPNFRYCPECGSLMNNGDRHG